MWENDAEQKLCFAAYLTPDQTCSKESILQSNVPAWLHEKGFVQAEQPRNSVYDLNSKSNSFESYDQYLLPLRLHIST